MYIVSSFYKQPYVKKKFFLKTENWQFCPKGNAVEATARISIELKLPEQCSNNAKGRHAGATQHARKLLLHRETAPRRLGTLA